MTINFIVSWLCVVMLGSCTTEHHLSGFHVSTGNDHPVPSKVVTKGTKNCMSSELIIMEGYTLES
jgi:hypothetical protein